MGWEGSRAQEEEQTEEEHDDGKGDAMLTAESPRSLRSLLRAAFATAVTPTAAAPASITATTAALASTPLGRIVPPRRRRLRGFTVLVVQC